tara:strand:+ start:355 stop:909 length:555 start_codon:yes stop_codon:yes gene_type:complete
MKKKKMHGGPHMDKMMGGGKYKMGHGGMYGKKKMPHGGKHDMDMEMYGGGMTMDARNRSQMMQVGGKTLKEVDAMQNPGLAKLPTKVRNKMGYKQEGGKVAKAGYQTRVSQKDKLLKLRDPKLKGTKKYYDTSAFGDNPVTALDPNLANFINKSQIKELKREQRAVEKEARIRKLKAKNKKAKK